MNLTFFLSTIDTVQIKINLTLLEPFHDQAVAGNQQSRKDP